MTAKLISLSGQQADTEYEIDPAKGLAFAAPKGGRVEIRYQTGDDSYIVTSVGYPVTINGASTEQQVLQHGDTLAVGANEFRFDSPAEDDSDVKDTEQGIAAVSDEMLLQNSATVQVARVEFCEQCSAPITEADYVDGKTRLYVGQPVCEECHATLESLCEDDTTVEPDSDSESAKPQRKGTRRTGTAGRRGRTDGTPSKRKRGTSKRKRGTKSATVPDKDVQPKAQSRPKKPKAVVKQDTGTEEIEPVPVVKPAARKSRRAGSRPVKKSAPVKAKVDTGTEEIEVEPMAKRAKAPAAVTKKKDTGTEVVEPVPAAQPPKPKVVAKRSGTAKSGKRSTRVASKPATAPRRSSHEKSAVKVEERPVREKKVKEGPGAGAKAMAAMGMIFKSIGKVLLLILKGIGGFFKFIGRRISISRKKSAIRKATFAIGDCVQQNDANIISVSDEALDAAVQLKALELKADAGAKEKEQLTLDLGVQFFNACFNREKELTDLLKKRGDLELELGDLRAGKKAEKTDASRKRSGRKSAVIPAVNESDQPVEETGTDQPE